MKNIEKIYKFLKDSGFELLKMETSEFFGDYYDVLTNESFQLRFSGSKSVETVDIRSKLPNENWYDLALVKALLQNESNLNYVTTIDEYCDFLYNEFSNIAKLFSKENYAITNNKLEELGNKRAKQMFPKR